MRITTVLTLLACLTIGGPASADYSGHPRAAAFVSALAEQGVSSAEALALLRSAQKNPRLIEAEQKAPEKTRPWDEYLAIFLQPSRIKNGLKFWAQHQQTLERATALYGAPPEIVVAIIGVETLYGGYTGPHRVLDSLTTQGFDHPTRQNFFFQELVEYVLACREHGLDPYTQKGSYAGAMGLPQFMPSNYRRLAVDFNDDGRVDLWSAEDAIGSAAHYLQRYRGPDNRWHRDQPLIVAAMGTADPDWPLNPRQPSHSYQQISDRLTAIPGIPPETPVGIIELVGKEHREQWLGLPNFYNVLSYNPRAYYAMAVYRLARAIADQRARATAERD